MEENKTTQNTFEDALQSVKSDFDKDLELLSKQNSELFSNRKQEIEKELEVIDGASNKANGGSGK